MSRLLQSIVREVVGVGALAFGVAVAACTSITGSSAASTTVSTYSPFTGIEVDASALFERIGCGHGPGVAFKYVVEVYQALPTGDRLPNPNPDAGPPDPVAMSENDCFTDAVFENIGGTTLGATSTFSLSVDVYDDATYYANQATIDGNVFPAANPTTAANATAVDAIAKWTSICTVREEPNIQSLAACGPLVATGN